MRHLVLSLMSRGSFGINETTLGNWVKAYRENHAGDEPPLQLPERARLRELERENRELRMKAEFLSKAAAYAGDRCQVPVSLSVSRIFR